MKRSVKGYVTMTAWVEMEVEDPDEIDSVEDIYTAAANQAKALVSGALWEGDGVTFSYDGHKLWPNPDPRIYGIEGQP